MWLTFDQQRVAVPQEMTVEVMIFGAYRYPTQRLDDLSLTIPLLASRSFKITYYSQGITCCHAKSGQAQMS
jgi:hypothetical protein